MANLAYTIKRKIIGGLPTVGTLYNLDFDAQTVSKDNNVVRFETQSFAGYTQSRRIRSDYFYNVKTHILGLNEVPRWEEFFASVENMELFLFDAYGYQTTPYLPENVRMETTSINRVSVSNRHFTYNFRVRVE